MGKKKKAKPPNTLFWIPQPKKRGKGRASIVREMPPIKSKWKALSPADWPNFSSAKVISIDTETFDPQLLTHGPGYARGKGHLVGLSASVGREESIYLPMRHEVKKKSNCDPDKVLLWAKDNLTSPDATIIGANLQYDVGWLREEGVNINGMIVDVQIAERLIDENQLSYSLDNISKKYIEEGKVSNKLYKWCAGYYGGKPDGSQRKNMHRTPPALAGPYGESDAYLPYEIFEKQLVILREQELLNVFNLECAFTRILLDMRFRGVRIDIPYAEEMRERLIKLEEKLQKKLDKIAGKHVRFNASASIAGGFDNLGIPYSNTEPSEKHPDGQPSFTKVFLENCDHEIARRILEIREINKIRSTFVESAILDKHVEGIVYGTFKQLGTRSGRLSAELPNLQQAPSRTTIGKELRRCFIPDEGYDNWYRADVSQIQYRGLAHHAVGKGADKLRRRYISDPNTDFHAAAQVLIEEVTGIHLDRKPTKNINFGLMFGMMKKKLIRSLGLSEEKGTELFKAYHTGVPFVQATFDACAEFVQEHGYISTQLGRRSRFELWCEPYGNEYASSYIKAIDKFGDGVEIERAFAYKALVMLVQGEEADFIKGAMVKCYKDGIFDELGGVPALIVHDEIDGSCNLDTDREALLHMKEVMEGSAKYRVPILIDVEAGANWRDCEAI